MMSSVRGGVKQQNSLPFKQRKAIVNPELDLDVRKARSNQYLCSGCTHIRCSSPRSCRELKSSSASSSNRMSNFAKVLHPPKLMWHVMKGPDSPLCHKAVSGYTSLSLGVVLPSSLKKRRKDTIIPSLIVKGSESLRGPADPGT